MIKLLFLAAGLIFVIVRVVSYFGNKISSSISISRIISDPQKAVEYAALLDIMIERKPGINKESFDLIKSKIQNSPYVGNYEILYSQQLDDNRFLFFTELSYTDFDVTFNGKPTDVKKKAHHNFLLQHKSETNELEVYSEVPSDATDKFQKMEFLPALYQSTEQSSKRPATHSDRMF